MNFSVLGCTFIPIHIRILQMCEGYDIIDHWNDFRLIYFAMVTACSLI